MDWLFLGLSLAGALLTLNVHLPIYRHAQLAMFSWIAGWITGELALHWVAAQALITLGFIWGGVLSSAVGQPGLGISLVSCAALGLALLRARERRLSLELVLRDFDPALQPALSPTPDWRRLLQPLPFGHPDVQQHRGIHYHRARGLDLSLDVFHSRARPTRAPTLLQIHGGAWIFGDKEHQGQPLMHHLAERGWVCFAANYRLSPQATFPDHIVDVKRAIAWIREQIAEYGGDPNFLCITGGSAGGHLSSLAALTANDPQFQPGFEEVDTRLDACVPFYGIFDFLDRADDRSLGKMADMIGPLVFKCTPAENPELWESVCPVARIHSDAPPFLVIQGSHDSLVMAEEAITFVSALREKSASPVYFAHLEGAQHAFEIFHSPRTEYAVRGVAAFLERVWSDYEKRKKQAA